MEVGPVFGLNIGDLLEIYDPDSQSWKMSGCLFTGDYGKSSAPLPKSGIMRNGKVYVLVSLECTISGNECGLWPTPAASDGMGGIAKKTAELKAKGLCRPSGVRMGSSLKWEKRITDTYNGKGHLNPNLSEWLMGYPINWTELLRAETRLSLK